MDDKGSFVESVAEASAQDGSQPLSDYGNLSLDARESTDTQNRVGLALMLALVFVFLRFSYAHEMLAGALGFDLRLVLVVGIPALLTAIFNGALQRTFQWRVAQYWALFILWMFLAIPFSQWVSGSLDAAVTYFRTTFLVIFLVGGLTITITDCYRMMSAIGVAGLFSILSSKLFIAEDQQRLGLAYGGSISNANDYAAHLLMILPFVVWLSLSTEKRLMRLLYLGAVLYGLLAIAQTGSRAALLATVAVAFFLMFRAPGASRILYIAVFTVVAIGAILLIPQSLRERYMTLFVGNSDRAATEEAVSSTERRQYLLTTALGLALKNPVFGVGQNQFEVAEAEIAKSEGKRAAWQSPHNSYVQVATELGIPAFVCYIGAFIATFGMLNRSYRRCKERTELRKLAAGAFCVMVSMVGFGVAIFFINVPYSVYLPTLSGLAIAITRATDREASVSPEVSKINPC